MLRWVIIYVLHIYIYIYIYITFGQMSVKCKGGVGWEC